MKSLRENIFLLSGMTGLSLLLLTVCFLGLPAGAKTRVDDRFKSGEKLSYNISFGSFENAGYAEMFVASKGKIGEAEAVEIRGRIKSSNFVSSAFYLFDHSRTVFAALDSGLPLYHRTESRTEGLPKEKIVSFLEKPTTQFDLLTMIYRARQNGGAGTFSILEDGKSHSVDFAAMGGESVETSFNSYETTVSSVTSSYFAEIGVTEVQVNFSTDERKIPVRFRVKTERGTFEAVLASVVVPTPTPVPTATSNPVRTPTPRPTPRRIPTPTPLENIEDQPLSADIPFSLKETLAFDVTQNGTLINKVRFDVEKRTRIRGKDSLILKASVKESGTGAVFSESDSAEANVDPVTLVPDYFRLQTSGPLEAWAQNVRFDQDVGRVSFGSANSISVPVGTHSLLSLAYAVRSFNLSRSNNTKNPVNDTRVSLFLKDKPVVLTLRPSAPKKIKIGDESVMADEISIFTGDRNIDRYRPKLWLSLDARRLPLLFTFGSYRFELTK